MKYGKRNFWRVLRGVLKWRKRTRPDSTDYSDRIELTNELIFNRVDKAVRENKLYLRQVTINDLADIVGTNRTYISRAMQACTDGFINYMTRVKVEYLHDYILDALEQGRVLEDGEELAMNTGFINKRAMQRAVWKIYGKSLKDVLKSGEW